jgi:excisionase family DNA binding protein
MSPMVLASVAPASTPSQPVDLAAPGAASKSHTASPIVSNRPATTAKPLRTDRPWYTPAEVAKVLRVSRATIYSLIQKGELKAVRVGLSLRIGSDGLDALGDPSPSRRPCPR